MTKYIIIGIVAVLVVLTIIYLLIPNKKAINIFRKTRYTTDAKTEDEIGNVEVSYIKEDILLKVNTDYKVGKKEKIIPGKYKILSADENAEKFNIRLHDRVREYSHNTDIVLAEGDIICPVSHNIILR